MTLIQQAIAFRQAFEFPAEFTEQRFLLQQGLITEEFVEVIEACSIVKQYGFSVEQSEHLLKELADLVFVCYQMAALMKWDLDEAMRRVFESNMSKLGDDGKPVRREDGKVLKGPNYAPPVLTDIITSHTLPEPGYMLPHSHNENERLSSNN